MNVPNVLYSRDLRIPVYYDMTPFADFVHVLDTMDRIKARAIAEVVSDDCWLVELPAPAGTAAADRFEPLPREEVVAFAWVGRMCEKNGCCTDSFMDSAVLHYPDRGVMLDGIEHPSEVVARWVAAGIAAVNALEDRAAA